MIWTKRQRSHIAYAIFTEGLNFSATFRRNNFEFRSKLAHNSFYFDIMFYDVESSISTLNFIFLKVTFGVTVNAYSNLLSLISAIISPFIF